MALAAVALVARLAHLVDYDEDIDTLRFALAVEDFDVAELRPHAPFYPVFVAAAKVVALSGLGPHAALGVVVAVSGAIVVVATGALAREVAGDRAGIFALALALTNPFSWLTSQKLLSDMPGVACTTAALCVLARARRELPERAVALRTGAIVSLGIALGVRLSYFPIAIACTAVVARTERSLFARLRDLTSGVVLWLVPLVVIGGAAELARTTWVQGIGHFTRWGGSAVTVPSPMRRLGGFVWGAWANVLAGPWPDAPLDRWIAVPVLVALAVASLRHVRRIAHEQPELSASTLAYLVWALFGQNVAHKPRHLLPLLPVVLVALAVGADALARRWERATLFSCLTLAVTWLVDGRRLVFAHAAPSPAAALVAYLRDTPDADRVVLTSDLGRMIATGAPDQRVVRLTGDQPIEAVLASLASSKIAITGEALDERTRRAIEAAGYVPVAVFSRPRSRYVDSLWYALTLHELRPR